MKDAELIFNFKRIVTFLIVIFFENALFSS